MGRLPRATASALGLFTLGSSLSETALDEVWLLQLPETKVGKARSESRDPLKGLFSLGLHHSLRLANPSLPQFWSPESSSASSPVPWLSSGADEPLFGNGVPTSFSDFDDAPLWLNTFKAENDKARRILQRKNESLAWPLSDREEDNSNYGRILEKVPVGIDPGTFALQTVHGKRLEVSANMSVVANASATNESRQLFSFIKLPFDPNLVVWYSHEGGCCVKAEKTGGLVIEDLDPKGLRPFVFTVEEQEGYVLLDCIYGHIAANLDARLEARWRSRLYATTPFELGDFMEENWGQEIPPGRSNGIVSGLVVVCLCFLAGYNIQFAARSKAPAIASATRLGTFDIVRFVLESLVLHIHLGVHGVYPSWHGQYMTAFRMPAFVFVAGIFGSSMAYESLSKLLCCTLGTTAIVVVLRTLIWCVLHDPDTAWHGLLNLDLSASAGDYWFLIMLAFCRVFVTPIFYAARTYCGMRTLGPFLAVKLASYFLMHKAAQWQGWIFGMYNWHSALAFMPYFALGLLLTPTEWDTLLRRRRVQFACVGYLFLWYLLMVSPGFLAWNRAYCLPHFQKHGCRAHFDIGQIVDPITPSQFVMDIVYFAMRVGITISFTAVVVLLSEVVEHFWPYLNVLMAGWGSRTLYAYVIQQFTLDLLRQGDFWNHMTPLPLTVRIIIFEPVLPVFVNIVFSSKGTESLFRWILLPYWIKDIGENPHIIDYPRWLENRAKLTAGATKLAEKATSACGEAKAKFAAAASSAWARAKAKLAPGALMKAAACA